MVSADLPTPPAPTTTSLYSVMAHARSVTRSKDVDKLDRRTDYALGGGWWWLLECMEPEHVFCGDGATVVVVVLRDAIASRVEHVHGRLGCSVKGMGW